MTTSPAPHDTVQEAGGVVGARRVRAGHMGDGLPFGRLVGARETGGQLGASVVTRPPGVASTLSVRTRGWYLLQGTMTYLAATEMVELAAGDFIYLPRDTPPAYRTTGPVPSRYLALTVLGELLDLYEVGAPAGERRVPDGGVPALDTPRAGSS